MPLTDRDRSVLYQGLSAAIGDEQAVEAMLSHFPVRDADEPVTTAHFDAQLARIDVRFAEMETRLTKEFHQVIRSQTQWLIGVMITWGTIVIAASRLG